MHPKIFGKNLNNTQKLANHILEWSSDSKGGINLYALGSNWLTKHEVAPDVMERAIGELEAVIRKEVPFPDTITAATIKELKGLIVKIRRVVDKKDEAVLNAKSTGFNM